jgi:hypothetical protein
VQRAESAGGNPVGSCAGKYCLLKRNVRDFSAGIVGCGRVCGLKGAAGNCDCLVMSSLVCHDKGLPSVGLFATCVVAGVVVILIGHVIS